MEKNYSYLENEEKSTINEPVHALWKTQRLK
jgi:hypothetical protein